MSRATVICPRCQASLSAGRVPAPGKKIKCLKCGERFLANGNGQRGTDVPVAAPFAPPPGIPETTFTAAPLPASRLNPETPRPAVPVALGFAPLTSSVAARKRGLVLSLVLSGLALFLIGGTALAVYCFTAGEETPQDKKAFVNSEAPSEAPSEIPAPSSVAKPAVKEPAPLPVQPPKARSTPSPVPPAPKPPQPVQIARQSPDPRPPVPPDKQALINKAIDRGVAFLKRGQDMSNGTWNNVGGHIVGPTALCGLTLLECGVPKTDPSIRKAAKFVRSQALNQNQTYDTSLAVLFLDKLGEPKDKRLIQKLAARLIAGQNEYGGWTYVCRTLNPKEEYQLLTFLRQHQPALPIGITSGGGSDTPIGITGRPGSLPSGIDKARPTDLPQGVTSDQDKSLPTGIRPGDKPGSLPTGIQSSDKNAKPSGIPGTVVIGPFEPGNGLTKPGPNQNKETKPRSAPTAKEPAKKKEPRLRLEQLSPTVRSLPILSGRALPKIVMGPKGQMRLIPTRDDNSNTQFAMLALWVARRHEVPVAKTMELVEKRFLLSQHPDGGWSYQTLLRSERAFRGGWGVQSTPAMTCVGLIGLAVGHGSAEEMRAAKAGKALMKNDKEPSLADRAIKEGLRRLGTWIGRPTGSDRAPLTMNLYALWSVERVAILYDLKTIGGNDWYGWAVEMLLPNQQPDGSWWGPPHPGANDMNVHTCFALLVLKRVNLVQDLSDNLRLTIAITDPAAAGGSSPPKK
jgi:hypothetical protein